MSDFGKLHVWRKSHELAIRVHQLAGGIRGSGNASLRSQMVRSAMSIPTNIVEGTGQESRREFRRFLIYAAGSATELEYHLMIARDVHVISLTEYSALASRTVEVRKMLRGLVKRVEGGIKADHEGKTNNEKKTENEKSEAVGARC